MKEKFILNLKNQKSYSIKKYYIIQTLFILSYLFFALIVPYDIEKIYPNVSEFIDFFKFIQVVDILDKDENIKSGIIFYFCFMLVIGLIYTIWHFKNYFYKLVILNGFLGINEPVKDGIVGKMNEQDLKLVKNPFLLFILLICVYLFFIYILYYFFSGNFLNDCGDIFERRNNITYLQKYQTKLGASYTTAIFQGIAFYTSIVVINLRVLHLLWLYKNSKNKID